MKNLFLSIGECMIEFTSNNEGVWTLGYGGDTLNTAWNFRLATKSSDWDVSYFTRIGSDVHSKRMIAFMAGNGILTESIGTDSELPTGLYIVETKHGERSFTYWRDRSAARHLADDPKPLDMACKAASAIFFSGITLAILPNQGRRTLLEILARVKRMGKPVVFDPNFRPQLWENNTLMQNWVYEASRVSTSVLPSFEDEQAAFGDRDLDACAKRYWSAGVSEIVIKNSDGEMLIAIDGQRLPVPDLRKVQPKDTTGAGDAFNGAYLAARFDGLDPIIALRLAHGQAERTVMQQGALLPMTTVINK